MGKWFCFVLYFGVLGFVGELHTDRISDNKHVLYTHKNINIKYNKDQVGVFVYFTYVSCLHIDVPGFFLADHSC